MEFYINKYKLFSVYCVFFNAQRNICYIYIRLYTVILFSKHWIVSPIYTLTILIVYFI